MEINNGNGIPKIIDALVIQFAGGHRSIVGYRALEIYYASIEDFENAAMYRDHQLNPIKNTIS